MTLESQSNYIDLEIKQKFRDEFCNFVEMNKSKEALVPSGSKTLRPLQSEEEFNKILNTENWAITQTEKSNILFFDLDKNEYDLKLKKFFNRRRDKYINNGELINSKHGFLKVIDADHNWCVKFADRYHLKSGIEIYAEKQWGIFAGKYYNLKNKDDPNRITTWYSLDDLHNDPIIEITKRDLEDVFGTIKLNDSVNNKNSLIPMSEIKSDDIEIMEGHRHLELLRYAGSVYAQKLPNNTDKIILEMLLAKNNLMCKPPLDKSEVIKLQQQAKNKCEQKPTKEFLKDSEISTNVQTKTPEEIHEEKIINQAMTYLKEFDVKTSKRKLEEWNETQEIKVSETVLINYTKEAKNRINKEIQKRLTEKKSNNIEEDNEINLNYARDSILALNHFLTINDKNRDLHIYKNGYYVKGGEDVIDSYIENNFEEESTKGFRFEVLEKIKIKTLIEKENLDNDENIINCKNRLYNLETGQVLPHTPEHKSITQWNITIDKKAKCGNFFKFINDVILEPMERVTVYQMMSSLLWKNDPLTKSYFLLGVGSNGKSSLRDIILKMVGKDNYSAISFEDFADKYLPAQLDNKIINFPDEIDDSKIVKSALWKSITAKRSFVGQNKFGHPFVVYPYCKIVMPCNRPPPIDDQSDGTYRRIVPIHFNQIFTNNLTEELEKQGQKLIDENFVKSLLEEKEISGIFNTLVSCLRRLKKDQRLINELTVAQVRNEWESLADSVKGFVKDCLIEDKEGIALKTDYYRKYLDYCKDKKYNAEGQNTFYMKFQNEGAISKKERLNKKSNPQSCFAGFKMKIDLENKKSSENEGLKAKDA